MNVAETIQRKVFHLPLKAQEEVLEAVEHIEEKYDLGDKPTDSEPYPLGLIANLATDMGVTDFSDRHDYYANGKLED